MLDTDACDKKIRSVQLQKQPDRADRPIAYCFCLLHEFERAYDTTHCRCLAVRWAVLLLRPYLEECRFTVCTDHDALKWNLNLTDSTGSSLFGD